MKYFLTKQNREQGFALLLSIIIASVVLAIGVSILKISVSQLQLSATGRESEVAFQASQSLTECLTYHRYENELFFIARPGDPADGYTPGNTDRLNAPEINCMNSEPIESYSEILANSDDRHIVKFHYTYDWGSGPELCSSGDMYVMVPLDDTGYIEHTFPGTSVGDDGDGLKRCNAGNVCTMWVTQGYNRPCAELNSSLFTVQRELTTES